MSLRALIFDVDGTLADTEDAQRRAFNTAFADHGLGWFWNQRLYTALLGVTGGKERLKSYIERLALPETDRRHLISLIPALHATKTHRYAGYVKNGQVPLREGVADLLEEARAAGLLLAIASTTTRSNVDELLMSAFSKNTDDIFDVVACGDEVEFKKPAPDIYHLVLSRLGVAANEAIAFEDSVTGLLAAKTANLFTVVSPTIWTQAQDFTRADCVVRSLDGLFGVRGLLELRGEHTPNRIEAA